MSHYIVGYVVLDFNAISGVNPYCSVVPIPEGRMTHIACDQLFALCKAHWMSLHLVGLTHLLEFYV